MFETSENNAEMYKVLSEAIVEVNVDTWKDHLRPRDLLESVEWLFNYWDHIHTKNKLKTKDDYKRFIQIFSLLENVFRNILLRPYIPAYRTINMNSGRYSSFVTSDESTLFLMLGFKKDSADLLTYDGLDTKKTILYAITFYVFGYVLSMKLNTMY